MSKEKRSRQSVIGLLRDPVFRTWVRSVRKYWHLYAGAIGSQIGLTIVSLLFAETGRRLFDAAPHVPAQLLVLLLTSFVCLTILRLGLRFCNDWVRSNLNESVVYEMRRDILNHLQRLPLGYHEKSHSSTSVNMMHNELEIVKNFLVSDIQKLIALPISFVIVGVYLLTVHPLLGCIALLIGPLQLISNLVRKQAFQEMARKQNEVTRQTFFQIGETLQGIREVKANQLEDHIDSKMSKLQHEGVVYNVALTKIRSLRGIAKDIPGQIGYVVGLGLGAVMMASGQIGVGGLVAFITLLDRVSEPFTTVVEVIDNLQRFVSGAHRLHDMMHLEEEDMDRGIPMPEHVPDIAFHGVTFGYRDDRSALQNVSFTIPAGATVAFVGPSGAGKSTLLKLLYRFYEPQQGTIAIDGKPLEQYTIRSLRQRMALVSQDMYLFDASVYDNITLGNETFSLEQVQRSARLAQADAFIQQLPEGYDTFVGERGIKLSHGQKQRISIARAILRGAPILILDEPTSALDVETEQSFQRDLGEWADHCTKLIIAHRLSTIRQADLVLFIEDGTVAEIGTPAQLLDRPGKFRSYWEKQTTGAFQRV